MRGREREGDRLPYPDENREAKSRGLRSLLVLTIKQASRQPRVFPISTRRASSTVPTLRSRHNATAVWMYNLVGRRRIALAFFTRVSRAMLFVVLITFVAFHSTLSVIVIYPHPSPPPPPLRQPLYFVVLLLNVVQGETKCSFVVQNVPS